jgi:hypothetical protein
MDETTTRHQLTLYLVATLCCKSRTKWALVLVRGCLGIVAVIGWGFYFYFGDGLWCAWHGRIA